MQNTSLSLNGRLESTLQICPESPARAFDGINYWQHHEKLSVLLKVDGETYKVEYVLAPESFLNMLYRNEKFGVYFGEMMFISSQLAQNHPDWVHYIIMKLFGERFIDQGLDDTGRVKHWDALMRSIRIAGTQMEEHNLRAFLLEIMKYEQTRYFELDEEVRLFVGQSLDPLIAKRQYLNAHHYNRWVARGRAEEDIYELTGNDYGFRNHAEALLRMIGDLSEEDQFIVGRFVHLMIGLPENTPIVIHPPFNKYAYLMTKDINGLTDLVSFDEKYGFGRSEDMITKVTGKYRTWSALSKRLSYGIHKTEEAIQSLIESKRDQLDGLVISGKTLAHEINDSVQKINQLVAQGFFTEAQDNLAAVGTFESQLTQLREVSSELTESLSNLQHVSIKLRELI